MAGGVGIIPGRNPENTVQSVQSVQSARCIYQVVRVRPHGSSLHPACVRIGRRRVSTYVGRRWRMAWMMVPSSSQSSSPPTGTPRAREVISTPVPARRSAM